MSTNKQTDKQMLKTVHLREKLSERVREMNSFQTFGMTTTDRWSGNHVLRRQRFGSVAEANWGGRLGQTRLQNQSWAKWLLEDVGILVVVVAHVE